MHALAKHGEVEDEILFLSLLCHGNVLLMNQRNTFMDITKVGEGFSLSYDIKPIE